ncbi:solute:sodium symporter family transporter [Proteiniclasticum ruminis]|uniref:Solute:Na+ symporter, SSS family n=1 Tax=Proteiniclasticum ruminis TaxID=398199 RepID=A0A1I5BYG4_9CLOT|nr:solute:sodium symporter family transporter [Proteiniclasticum ruminis]SFN79743.1 solute:Na+ symporter, SSS family [Proteiniclasticum ruminis]
MNHLFFTLLTFVLFTALVGIVSSKLVTKDDQTTSKGYFLAGNGLSGIFIAGSMMLTNLSAENLVGLSGQSYGFNMSGMAWESTAVVATIVMAFLFLPIYLKKGYTTLPEFMEDRYGTWVRRAVSLLFLIGYLVVGIPVTLYAGAIGFNQIFNLPEIFGISSQMSLTIIIVLVGIVGAAYAVFGGLKAVAVSDTINGILLVVGGVLIPVFGFIVLGQTQGGGFFAGIAEVLNNAPEKFNAIGSQSDPVPFATIFTGMVLANLFYWGTNQVLIQRTLGAKNLKEGQKGVLLSGFLKMLVPLIMVIPGVIASRLIPGLEQNDFAYPSLVAKVLPWPLVGLFCAALFGAIVSTYNSFLNSASTIFMLDFYKPIINPKISDRDLVKKAKFYGTLFAVFAICFTPFLQVLSTGLYNFGRSFTGFYNIPIITLVLIGMFTRFGSVKGAKIAIGWHIFFYSGYKFWFKLIDSPITEGILKINFIHTYAISFIIMIFILVVTTNKEEAAVFQNEVKRDDNYDMTPWMHKNETAIWLISFLIYNYIIFSPLGIATENRNNTFIFGVTVALVLETVGLLLYAKKKRKNASLTTETSNTEAKKAI